MNVITELKKDVKSLAERMDFVERQGVQEVESGLGMQGLLQKLGEQFAEAVRRLKSLETREAEIQILFERLNRLEKVAKEEEVWWQDVRRHGREISLLRDVVVAAAAIRRKINGQLQVLNAQHWLGPELRALDEAFKAVDKWEQ